MHPQRLSDKVLAAFHQACEQGNVEAADHLLRALEAVLTRFGGAAKTDRRGETGPVVEAYDRLETLKRMARPAA